MQKNQTRQEKLPPFQMGATTSGAFSDEEIDRLIADHKDKMDESRLGTGRGDQEVRRSQVAFLKADNEHRWIYDRIWSTVVGLNEQFFCVGIDSIADEMQLARYDSTDQGYYDWHVDFGDVAPYRKISVSVQLSDPADYDGGNLELFFRRKITPTDRARGTVIAFPSFVMHRVTPVTRGTRWSLVAWVSGPRWF